MRWAFCLLLLCLAPALARADMPLKANDDGILEFQVTQPSRTLVVLVSGDGGLWGDLDAQLAKRLVQEGYAVVGLDTRIWFAQERQATEVAARLAGMMRTYMAKAHASRVVFTGYSYGADVLPIAYNRLAPDYRAKVSALVFIAPTRQTMLQVTLAERTGLITGDIRLAPEYAKLPVKSVICVYGHDEAAEAGCTLPELKDAVNIELPGGHHFDYNPRELGDRVVSALTVMGLP
jgi:type IV secretory pathway VirJ component